MPDNRRPFEGKFFEVLVGRRGFEFCLNTEFAKIGAFSRDGNLRVLFRMPSGGFRAKKARPWKGTIRSLLYIIQFMLYYLRTVVMPEFRLFRFALGVVFDRFTLSLSLSPDRILCRRDLQCSFLLVDLRSFR